MQLRSLVIGAALAAVVTIAALATLGTHGVIHLGVLYGEWSKITRTVAWSVFVLPASVPTGALLGWMSTGLRTRRLLVLIAVAMFGFVVIETIVLLTVGIGLVRHGGAAVILRTIVETAPYTLPWVIAAAWQLERATRPHPVA